MPVANGKILALDVGAARIGLALAHGQAKLATPAGAVVNGERVAEELRAICQREDVVQLVIGLPRGMAGQDTEQTAAVRAFGAQVANELALPLVWQDEALTSVHAEEELEHRGKPYTKADIDALSATYILEDYLHEHL